MYRWLSYVHQDTVPCRVLQSAAYRFSSSVSGPVLCTKPPVCLPNGLLIELPYCWRVHELKKAHVWVAVVRCTPMI
jgi:hypothetical protein